MYPPTSHFPSNQPQFKCTLRACHAFTQPTVGFRTGLCCPHSPLCWSQGRRPSGQSCHPSVLFCHRWTFLPPPRTAVWSSMTKTVTAATRWRTTCSVTPAMSRGWSRAPRLQLFTSLASSWSLSRTCRGEAQQSTTSACDFQRPPGVGWGGEGLGK